MQSDSVASPPAEGVSARLKTRILDALRGSGGWMGFEAFMALALYEPGLGYYNNAGRVFGTLPQDGSDFATAPEMTPLFGQAVAAQVRQALDATGTHEVWEFGAGSGALAAQVIAALGPALSAYTIVDLSGSLRERQRVAVETTVPDAAHKLRFADRLPERIEGVVIGNEVLDAMPVALLHFDGHQWWERGVVADGDHLAWADRPTELRPPVDGPFLPGMVTEIHRQAEAFIGTVAHTLQRGAAFFIDYGFPEAEYYHLQRHQGTLMCHHQHQADADPLVRVGEKDITAHVNFTGIALAAQEAGWTVLGYTTQARFLMNCGLLDLLNAATDRASLRDVAHVQKLLTEHEMGELFKVIGLAPGAGFDALGFAAGDRTHTL